MDCSICFHREISKLSNGTFHEPKTDQNVIKRICSSCVQKLMFMKASIIPWDGVIVDKEEQKEIPKLRRRRR